MATYKEIKGVTIQTLDRIQLLEELGGSWSSGGNLNKLISWRKWSKSILTAASFAGGYLHQLVTADRINIMEPLGQKQQI